MNEITISMDLFVELMEKATVYEIVKKHVMNSPYPDTWEKAIFNIEIGGQHVRETVKDSDRTEMCEESV